jgi:alpha-tubulin suppressor-like RCC1 family protein
VQNTSWTTSIDVCRRLRSPVIIGEPQLRGCSVFGPKSRVILIYVTLACGITTACDIAGPNDTYDIPRAVTRPIPVSGTQRFSVVSSGFMHTCAIDTSGSAWCWGDNRYQQTGQANSSPCPDFGNVECVVRPAPVAPELRFASISAGGTHTCALTVEGAAYCWGGGYHGNDRGVLGNGQLTLSAAPVPVSGGLRFRTISAGGRVTCAIAVDGRGYCWGMGGTVGDGTREDALVPTPVSGNLEFIALSSGGVHSCGVITDGSAFCWGSNQYGQIGDGRMTGLMMGSGSGPIVPTGVTTDLVFESIVAGGNHTCATTRDNMVFCWGYNHVGQLGTGAPGAPQATPRAVVATGLTGTTGNSVHTCALRSGGEAVCWGGNWFGAIGDGTSTAQNTGSERPVPTTTLTSIRFSAISAGGSHTCALATDGRAWCWGDRGRGQLGDVN